MKDCDLVLFLWGRLIQHSVKSNVSGKSVEKSGEEIKTMNITH